MQYALDVASIAVEIFVLLLAVWLLYDIITAYSARRRFARLLALRRFWLRNRSSQASAALATSGNPRKYDRRRARHQSPPNLVEFGPSDKSGRGDGVLGPVKQVGAGRRGRTVRSDRRPHLRLVER